MAVIPTLVAVDREGVVGFSSIGRLSPASLKELESVLDR